MERLEQGLAQQVVDTVKSVCGNDVNYINCSGVIFVSTNPRRVGTFHEAGYKAAQEGVVIEVYSDTEYAGSQQGINFPFYHHGELLAVIGITGEPDRVRKYAQLAERITNLLIREKEVRAFSLTQTDKRHYILDSLLHGAVTNENYLNQCLNEFHVNLSTEKRLILIKIRENMEQRTYSSFDQEMRRLFHTYDVTLYAFYYPNEYVVIVEENIFQEKLEKINQLIKRYQEIFRVTAGKTCTIYNLRKSYESAQIAMRSEMAQNDKLIIFDDLVLEILFSQLEPEQREMFLQRTIERLGDEEKKILRVYFENELSLQETSKCLFLHKNTLQYKLNAIARRTGFNPRKFQEAVVLYLALHLE